MIWFFLMGMIAGAVGMTMFASWWIHRHAKPVTSDDLAEILRKAEEEEDKPND